MKIRLAIVALIAAAVLCGCYTYRGPSLKAQGPLPGTVQNYLDLRVSKRQPSQIVTFTSALVNAKAWLIVDKPSSLLGSNVLVLDEGDEWSLDLTLEHEYVLIFKVYDRPRGHYRWQNLRYQASAIHPRETIDAGFLNGRCTGKVTTRSEDEMSISQYRLKYRAF